MLASRSKAHEDFMNHGHGLALSSWDAWFCAYQYAAEINSPILNLIEKGCDYAEKMKPIPERYLAAAQSLFYEAISKCSQARQ